MGGTQPDPSALRLRLASRSRNPRKIAQVVEELYVNASLTLRVLHLEGKSIFGSAKRKLDLPLGDESDSHRHDRISFILPKIGWNMIPRQICCQRSLT